MAAVTDTATDDAHLGCAGAADGVARLIVACDGSSGAVKVVVELVLAVDDVAHDVVGIAAFDFMDGVAHRGERTAAEDIVVDDAAGDADKGVAEDAACREAVVVVPGLVLVDSAAAAVDVAGENGCADAFAVLDGEGAGEGRAYLATHDFDMGVAPHVAVLAAAEHRAAHSRAGTADVDSGVVDVVVVGVVEGVPVLDMVAGLAEAGSVDIASGVDRGGHLVVEADDAASDVDGGQAGVRGDGIVVGCSGEFAQRGQLAAAVDILLHTAAADVDGGVAGDVGGQRVADISLSGTEDVAGHDGVDCLGVGVLHVDFGVAVDIRQCAAAEHVAAHKDVGCLVVVIVVDHTARYFGVVRGVVVADVDLRVGDGLALVDVLAGALAVGIDGAAETQAAAVDVAEYAVAVPDVVDVDYRRVVAAGGSSGCGFVMGLVAGAVDIG